MALVHADGTDASPNYQLLGVQYGTLRIVKRQISVKPTSAEKIYDATPLVAAAGDYVITSGTLLAGHNLSVATTGATITEPGSVYHEFTANAAETYTVVDENGTDVSAYYQLTLETEPGTLTVTKRTLIVRAKSDSKGYDGMPLVNDGYDAWGLLEGLHELSVVVEGEQTEPGSSPNRIVQCIVRCDGEDVTDRYYEVDLEDGTLTVTNPDEEIWVSAEKTGDFYLRKESYGYFNYKSWLSTEPYTASSVSPLYYTGIAARQRGVLPTSVLIGSDSQQFWYWIPYNVAETESSATSDTYVSHLWTGSYSLSYYDYKGIDLSLQGTGYEAEEAAYYQNHVLTTYLQIPQSTKEGMLRIASANGISATDPDVIERVRSFVQNYRPYEMERDYTAVADDALGFFDLEKTQGAICQNYAMSATMMYRALGIPARYTVGYHTTIKAANVKQYLEGEEAHAWVEVYIKGMGWVMQEVTGAISKQPALPTLRIKPFDMVVSSAQATTLKHNGEVVDVDGKTALYALTERGYTYKASIVATSGGAAILNGVGTLSTKIASFTLYDEDGVNVTDTYELTYETGEMKITDKLVVNLLLSYKSKIYDALPNAYSSKDYWSCVLQGSDALKSGVSVEFDIESVPVITDVGRVYEDDIRNLVKVVKNGLDITASCEIVVPERRLEIVARYIKIVANSASKVYDGKPLSDSGYVVSGLPLVDGHALNVVVYGTITNVGTRLNLILSYTVKDAEGRDLTDNYEVERVHGTLQVKQSN